MDKIFMLRKYLGTNVYVHRSGLNWPVKEKNKTMSCHQRKTSFTWGQYEIMQLANVLIVEYIAR